MLKPIGATLTTTVHGPIPPNRFWGYYTGPEIKAMGEADPNATAVINVGAVEQHGPHLPVMTDTLQGSEILGAALARLPEDQRVAIVLCDVYGMDYNEVAAMTSAALGTVKSRIHRGRLALRELLLDQMELFRR